MDISSRLGLRYRSWNPWIFKDEELYRLFYLNTKSTVDPFWSNGEISTAISYDMRTWSHLQTVIQPNPENIWESGRMLAGHLYKEDDIYYLFYSASPPPPLLLQEGIGLATSVNGLNWHRRAEQLLEPDGIFYGVSRPFSNLQHRQWRDPYVVKDYKTSRYYMFMSASSQEGDFNFRGCVGLAVANKIDGPYKLLPPAAYPKIENRQEGIYYEIERPQVIYKNSKYYLFFSCWHQAINPKWLRKVGNFRVTDSSLYCYVSSNIEGPFEPLTEKPIVLGSDKTGLYGTNFILGSNGDFFAYGWYSSSFTLEVSSRFPVQWEGDDIEILLPTPETDYEGSQQKLSAIIFNRTSVPRISTVSKDVKRPFWSVMIPTYNCANYLAETLKSVLEQDPGADQMQIEVVDDCSTKDDPEAVVREIGKGRVSFFRQPHNVGATANFNTCIQRAKGQWVHILHGDDTVLSGFYSRLQASLEKEPDVSAAFCRHICMNENSYWQTLSFIERQTPGILENWLELISISNRILSPAIVVRRSVYEQLGGFHTELIHAADWEMWKRIAANYPIWYDPQPLACYREHSASDTSRLVKTGANVADIRKTIDISRSYLPTAIADELSIRAREYHALDALNRAYRMLCLGYVSGALAQIREGLKCSSSQTVIRTLANLLATDGSEQLLKALAHFFKSPEAEKVLTESLEINNRSANVEFELSEINLVILPDWERWEDLIYQDLASVIYAVITHINRDLITLFIDTSNIDDEEANSVLSSVVLELMMQEDIDVVKEPKISFCKLSEHSHWKSLLPHLHARIVLENENKQLGSELTSDKITLYTIECFRNQQVVQLETGAWAFK